MSYQQLHKRLSDEQVHAIIYKYTHKELSAKEARQYLTVSKSRFYQLVARYQDDPQHFTVAYERTGPTRKLDSAIEKNLLKELKVEKEKIIDNPLVPTTRYNYSYVKQLLNEQYHQKVALSTIIDRARQHGYWKQKPPKKVHDREVITNYVGELIQHDSSHHLWAPDGKQKWYLITSLDDHSRALLYADFWLRETSWYHIVALQSVVLKHGVPLSYYADQHRIFRYAKDRDKHSPWALYTKFTDDVDPQWKMVLKDCGVQPIYALSPQAKGKIERPCQWLQDHIVRTCVRRGIASITEARKVLSYEVQQYNEKRVHSTTGEIPFIRLQRARREKQSLFREFALTPPFQSAKDIFCLRITRVVDSYRKVSLKGFVLRVPDVPPRQTVELRLVPDLKTGITEIRFWCEGHFTGSQRVKNSDVPIVQF